MRLKVSLIAVAVVALVSLGSAQQGQGGGRRQGMRGGGGAQRLTQLLRNPQVQEELKVTDDEKTKIEDLPRPQRPQGGGGGFTPPTPEEQMKQFSDDKAATAAILTADQEKRLEELRIQWAGSNAVFAPDIQAGLGLSDDQKTKLTTLQTQQRAAMRDAMQNAGEDREAMMATMQKMQATMKTEVEKVLTDDQKAKLKAMGGAELKQAPMRRPGGGGGAPPRA